LRIVHAHHPRSYPRKLLPILAVNDAEQQVSAWHGDFGGPLGAGTVETPIRSAASTRVNPGIGGFCRGIVSGLARRLVFPY